MKKILAVIMLATIVTVGCTASWISVALADLPVLVQMALNIATFAQTAQGSTISPGEIAAINGISAEASKDLNLLQTLYNQYQASPNADVLAQMETVIATINTNLPALLTAAHLKDAALAQQVTAGVGLILATVTSFAALIPQPSNPAVALMKAKIPARVKPLGPEELKKAWNTQVAPQFKLKKKFLGVTL